jgi:hypothetical protein
VQNEVFGREGGVTGGMIGSWLVGGTLAGGTIIGIASRGKFGAVGKAAGKFRSGTRVKIEDLRNFYKQGVITDKHSDKVAKLIRKHKSGQDKDFDYDQLDWLHKRYTARNLFSGNPKSGNSTAKVTAPTQANSPQAQAVKTKRPLTKEERQVLREHRQKIRGIPKETADSRRQTAAEILPPIDPKVLTDDALAKLRAARGGGASLRIEKGNDDALVQLAKDIANVSDTYDDPEQQFKVAEALVRKAAQQNTKGNPPKKFDEFFNDLYGRVIDIKKK